MSYKMINCLRMKFFKTGIFIAFIMCWAATAWGQQTVLQGGVYFATKDNPLPGVSVMLVNRNGLVLSGVNTNENGQFRIPLHSEAETIVFTMIGFKTQELRSEERSVGKESVNKWRIR